MKNKSSLILLNIILMLYSLNSIFSKLAANEDFLSFKFVLFYGLVVFLLGIYAVGWQQVIKKMPLTSAYANKAICIVWGLIWGVLFFQEKVTLFKIIGILLVIAGVVLFSLSDGDDIHE